MKARVRTPELMDDPHLPAADHELALAGLQRLNILSAAARPVIRQARTLLARAAVPAASASILDVATGGGDLLIALGRAGLATAPGARLIGVDISDTALAIAARRAAAAGVTAQWLRTDVLAAPLPLADQSVDVAVCSLFLHHLDAPDVARVLAEMARVSRIGVVISDLRRSRVGLALAAIAGRAVTRSAIVHTDSLLSVRAAWSADELAAIARSANLTGTHIRRIWPARLLLTWSRP